MPFVYRLTLLLKILLLFLCVLFGVNAFAQEEPNLDDYVLDTIIKQSLEDLLVFDTVIVARKKVIIQEQVIIENEQERRPVFTNYALSAFYKRGFFFPEEVKEPSKYLHPRSFAVGAGLTATTEKSYSFTAQIAYVQEKEQFNAQTETPYTTYYNDTTKYILDEFYVVNPVSPTDTAFYVIEDFYITEKSETELKTESYSEKDKYHKILLSFAIGKSFSFKNVLVTPQIGVSYYIMFNSSCHLINEDNDLATYQPQNQNLLALRSSLSFKMPVWDRIGIEIIPDLEFFSKKNKSLQSCKSVSGGFSAGVFVNFP